MQQNKNIRIPPQSIGTEKIIIASILTYPDILDDYSDKLKPEYFYTPKHETTVRAIEWLFRQGKPLDIVSVSERIESDSAGDMTHLTAYLSEVLSTMSVYRNLDSYFDVLISKFNMRKMIEVSQRTIEDCYNPELKQDDILNTAESGLMSIHDHFEAIKTVHIIETFDKFMEELDPAKNPIGKIDYPTGFKELDELTGGHHRGEMTVIGGRPGMGKTSLMMDFLINVKKRCLFFSCEMPKIQITQRYVSQLSGIPVYKIRNRFLSDVDRYEIKQSLITLSKTMIWIDDDPIMTIPKMRSRIRKQIKQNKIEFVAVDYLQLMRGTAKNQSINDKTTEISNGIMALAKEFDLPILIGSQLSRDIEKRPKDHRRPVMADLRDSGSIEQDAHVVLFPYRNYVYSNLPDEKYDAEIIIGKQRNGPSGVSINVGYKPEITHFYNKQEQQKMF